MPDLLRILTCGSADDGKSTLIERLLLDGPAAERAQEITIDVAHRAFSTPRRNYIVADTPGHAQYTRDMVTGATTADAAIVLVDARKGVLTQTRRHTHLLTLLGVRQLLLAINRIDLVGYAEETFRAIEADYLAFARRLGITAITCIPVCALDGDNLVTRSPRTAWYRGPTLLDWLEAAEPDASFGHAVAGRAIPPTLEDELNIDRGDLICAPDSPAGVADQFRVTLIWMSEVPLLPGRSYLMKIGATTVGASVTQIRHEIDVDSLAERAARQLELNSISVCNFSTDRPIAFDPYAKNRATGGFILIDRLSHETVGAGLVQFALRRAQNVHVQALDVDKAARAQRMGQKPCVLWFTGLSGAGKSTIANAVEKKLHALGRHTYLLDGDNLRHGLNRDLGFTDAERVENIRRVAEVAKLMVDAGLIVLASFISPFRSERRMARALFEADEFIEIFVDAPLAVAEARDPKGLYAKARRGELPHFTGIDSPYEAPEFAELRIDAERLTALEAAGVILEHISSLVGSDKR